MPIPFHEKVYALVRQIPPGKVLSYGRVGQLLGMPHGAREVGWAMSVLPDKTVPWHRVVNAQGRVSIKGKPEAAALQRARLEAEGITFDKYDRLDMERHQWDPAPPEVEQIMQKARGKDDESG